MNFHAFRRPELKAMGDVLADRIVGPRAAVRGAAAPAVGRLTGPRGTLCYPGAVPGV